MRQCFTLLLILALYVSCSTKEKAIEKKIEFEHQSFALQSLLSVIEFDSLFLCKKVQEDISQESSDVTTKITQSPSGSSNEVLCVKAYGIKQQKKSEGFLEENKELKSVDYTEIKRSKTSPWFVFGLVLLIILIIEKGRRV